VYFDYVYAIVIWTLRKIKTKIRVQVEYSNEYNKVRLKNNGKCLNFAGLESPIVNIYFFFRYVGARAPEA